MTAESAAPEGWSAATREVTPEGRSAATGEVTPEGRSAATGEVTPEGRSAATGEVTPEARRSRGDRQRDAIITAVRELLKSGSFADLSVSVISERAGVARSGFYFYFDSKYAVLAVVVAEAMAELDKLTHDFAPREPGESPSDFAKRMVGSAAAVFASNDPIMAACTVAQNTDAQIREIMNDFEDTVIDKIVGLVEQDAGARPISDDLPALVRMLTAMTSMTLTHDSAFIGRGEDPARAVEVVERLWLYGLWGGSDLRGD